MAKLPYDNNKVNADDRSPLPKGVYNVVVKGSELRATRSGAGEYIRVMFQVEDGPAKGRVCGNNYNVLHTESPEAERIGRQQLKGLGVACGVPNMQDTDELTGRRCQIQVDVNGSYNDVTAVLPPKGAIPRGNSASARSVAAQAPPVDTQAEAQTTIQPEDVAVTARRAPWDA